MMPTIDENMGFDPDDLVGIALGVEDPLYLEQVHYAALRDKVIDESGVDGKLSELLDKEVNQEAPEDIDMDFSDLMPDDSDTTMDGMDVEDMADWDYDVESGEADLDIDLIDMIDDMEDYLDEI